MNNFPLHAFLASLAADDVILSVRDYERLLLMCQTGGTWTLARLKHVLTALLAKDEDQQRLIERKFDRFFDVQAAGIAIPEFDIRQVLEELKAAEAAPPSRPKAQPQERIPKVDVATQTEVPHSPRRASTRWLLGAVVVVLLIWFGLWKWLVPQPPLPQGPELQIIPRVLDFSSQLLNTSTEKTVILTNTGDEPLTINEIVLSENASTVMSSNNTGFGASGLLWTISC